MLEAYLDLDTSVKLMLTSRNHVILYDTFEYDSTLLDKLYKILSATGPSNALVITHAVYDTAIYDGAYEVWSEQVGDYIYYGAVSQLDINKLMCVFNAAKISDVKFYDKMFMYQYFLSDNQCIIDSSNGMYLLIAKDKSLANISYAKRNLIDQMLLQICRKSHTQSIVNFTTFIDYDCVRWFENYGTVLELPVYVQMTVFGFFKFIKPELCFDIDKIKFNSKLETVNYKTGSTEKEQELFKSVNIKDREATAEDHVVQNISQPVTENKKSAEKVRARNVPEKKKDTKKKRIDITLNVLLLLFFISLVVAFGISYYFKQDSIEKMQTLALARDDLTHKQLYLGKLQEAMPSEYAGVVYTLENCHPDYVVIGSITMDNTIEVVYYMQDGNTTDELISLLSNEFKINAIVDGGVVTLSEQNYKKFSISLSKK